MSDQLEKDRRRSIRIAWGITIGEAILLGAMIYVFVDYWLMLPIRFRVAGLSGLGVLTLIILFRIVRFHRSLLRLDKMPPSHQAPKSNHSSEETQVNFTK